MLDEKNIFVCKSKQRKQISIVFLNKPATYEKAVAKMAEEKRLDNEYQREYINTARIVMDGITIFDFERRA